jgi:hypothetical protein
VALGEGEAAGVGVGETAGDGDGVTVGDTEAVEVVLEDDAVMFAGLLSLPPHPAVQQVRIMTVSAGSSRLQPDLRTFSMSDLLGVTGLLPRRSS